MKNKAVLQKNIESFCPANRQDWRQWLQKNHCSKSSVWLVCYKKNSGKPTVVWTEAVDEALCFGWIDSIRMSLDDDTFKQLFSKRKPKGTWSKVNKEKIRNLISDGLMAEAGLESIEKAKQNGSWTILDGVEQLTLPEDLAAAFNRKAGSEAYFLGLSKSVKKAILQWLVFAKRPDTRQKRINEIAENAAQKLKPGLFI